MLTKIPMMMLELLADVNNEGEIQTDGRLVLPSKMINIGNQTENGCNVG